MNDEVENVKYKYSDSQMYSFNDIDCNDMEFEDSCMKIIVDYPVPNYLDKENEEIYEFVNRAKNKLEYKKQVIDYVTRRFYKTFNYIENIHEKVKIDILELHKGIFKINSIKYKINELEEGEYEILIGEREEELLKIQYDDYLCGKIMKDEDVDKKEILKIINKRLSTHEQICLSESMILNEGWGELEEVILEILERNKYNKEIKMRDNILMLLYFLSCNYAFGLIYYL
jgi:hypothetical protein